MSVCIIVLSSGTSKESSGSKRVYGGGESYKCEDHVSYKPSSERDYYGRDAYSEEPSYTYESRVLQSHVLVL